MRIYLLTMFALPVLELWDRLWARIAQPLTYDGCFKQPRFISVLEGMAIVNGSDRWCRVWVIRIPLVRTWGPAYPNFVNMRTEYGFREHYLIYCRQSQGKRWSLQPEWPS